MGPLLLPHPPSGNRTTPVSLMISPLPHNPKPLPSPSHTRLCYFAPHLVPIPPRCALMAASDAAAVDEGGDPMSIVPVVAPAPRPGVEKDSPGVEKASPGPPTAFVPADEGNTVVRSVVQRWRREDLLEKAGSLLRSLAWVFSLIAVAVLASNKRGGWMDFDHYQEYRYLLSVAVIALVYSTAQLIKHAHRFSSGKDIIPKRYSGIVDFVGDQVIAYLLISASSAAIPITDRMRQEVVNTFTEASVAAISMALLAFMALGISALLSGFKVSKRSYI